MFESTPCVDDPGREHDARTGFQPYFAVADEDAARSFGDVAQQHEKAKAASKARVDVGVVVLR